MNALKVLGTCRRLLMFFVLAFGLSWGNAVLSAASPEFPFLFPYGPLLAALIVASATSGRAGLKDLASRCLRWRVGLHWYAAACLVPVTLAFAAVGLNLLLGATLPPAGQIGPWYRPFLVLPEALIDAPLGEESGWRGFALPLFPAGDSALASSLVLGVLIAGWHLPLALSAPALAPYVIGTVASAVLANWVYYNARGSALLVMLYHTVQNAFGGWYLFRLFTGDDLARLWWLWSGLYCAAAVGVIILTGPTLSRRPVPRPDPQL